MAKRSIRFEGEEILTKKSKVVKKIDDRIKTIIDDMKETMIEENGVGLAAPQIGLLKRIIVIYSQEDDKTTVLINPEITTREGEQTGEEGCLSLPGIAATICRPLKVVVEALDENGEDIEISAEEYMARIICHEIDHLDGYTIRDRAIEIRKEED